MPSKTFEVEALLRRVVDGVVHAVRVLLYVVLIVLHEDPVAEENRQGRTGRLRCEVAFQHDRNVWAEQFRWAADVAHVNRGSIELDVEVDRLRSFVDRAVDDDALKPETLRTEVDRSRLCLVGVQEEQGGIAEASHDNEAQGSDDRDECEYRPPV